MDRDRLYTVLALVLIVLALGAVAATLDSGTLPGDQATTTTVTLDDRTVDPGGEDTVGAPPTQAPTVGSDNEGWSPPIGLVVGAFLLAFGATVVLLIVRNATYESVDADDETADDVDLTQVGEAAGDAADRIEADSDISNEVYRAWREMVRHLNAPSPETTTPEEFKSHAIEAGMDSEDVAELTKLFEEVRYGERDPAEREAQALAALRRIEAEYADATDTDDGGVER